MTCFHLIVKLEVGDSQRKCGQRETFALLALLYVAQQTLIGRYIISFFTIVLISFQSFSQAFKYLVAFSNRHF